MACDICGAKGVPLESVMDIYKTDDIQDICSDCAKLTNKALRRIQDSHGQAQRILLKRFMAMLKMEKQP